MYSYRLLLSATLLLTLFAAFGCAPAPQNAGLAKTHYMLGVSYLKEQDPTLALKEFLLAAELDGGDAGIQNGLGQAYQLKRAFAEAERHYRRALEISDNDPQYLHNLGALYLDMERWDDAIATFHRAADDLLFTRAGTAYLGIAHASYQKGAYQEAVTAAREALRLNPRSLRAYMQLGAAYSALDQMDRAVETYQRTLTIAPEFVWARYRLGLVYLQSGQRSLAVAAFNEVLRQDPDSDVGRLAREQLLGLP